jgi:hypothetical protein
MVLFFFANMTRDRKVKERNGGYRSSWINIGFHCPCHAGHLRCAGGSDKAYDLYTPISPLHVYKRIITTSYVQHSNVIILQ